MDIPVEAINIPDLLSDWFSQDNYKGFDRYELKHLEFEISKRAQLHEKVMSCLSYLDEQGKEPVLKLVNYLCGTDLSNVFSGTPSFTESSSIMSRRKLSHIKDISAGDNLDYLQQYQWARENNRLERSSGVRLRQGEEIRNDSHSLEVFRKKVESIVKSRRLEKEELRRFKFMTEYSSIAELPLDDEWGQDYAQKTSIPISVNLLEYTNEELINGFSKLLTELRDYYDLPNANVKSKKSSQDRSRIIKYNVIQYADIKIWCLLSFFNRLPETEIVNALFDGTSYDKGTLRKHTIPTWEKVSCPNYCLS